MNNLLGIDTSKPRCMDAVNSTIGEVADPFIIKEKTKIQMLEDAINQVWTDTPGDGAVHQKNRLVNQAIKSLGDVAAKEVIGKLGVWMVAVGGSLNQERR